MRCFCRMCASSNRNSAVFALGCLQTDPQESAVMSSSLLPSPHMQLSVRRASVFECISHVDAALSAAIILFLASGLFFCGLFQLWLSSLPFTCYSLATAQSEVDTQTALMIVQHWPCYCNFVRFCCIKKNAELLTLLSGSMSMSQVGWLQDLC